MSELAYAALDHTLHTWLSTGQMAFKIDGGPHDAKVVLVQVIQTNQDLNNDGVPDQLSVKIHSCIVVESTGVIVEVGTTPIQTPDNVHSVTIDALAAGNTDVPTWIAALIGDEIHRVFRQEAALNAWSQISV